MEKVIPMRYDIIERHPQKQAARKTLTISNKTFYYFDKNKIERFKLMP